MIARVPKRVDRGKATLKTHAYFSERQTNQGNHPVLTSFMTVVVPELILVSTPSVKVKSTIPQSRMEQVGLGHNHDDAVASVNWSSQCLPRGKLYCIRTSTLSYRASQTHANISRRVQILILT